MTDAVLEVRVTKVLTDLFEHFEAVKSALVVVNSVNLLNAITDYVDNVVKGNDSNFTVAIVFGHGVDLADDCVFGGIQARAMH